jgi:lysophospholipase
MADAALHETDPLRRRRSLPAGGITRYIALRDGWPVRVWQRACTAPDGDRRGTILLVGGRADYIEKYAETCHDLADAGWSVCAFDWRGQGLSRRVGRSAQHGASPGFGVWADDMAEMVAWAAAASPGPLVAIGHSMGGHFLLRHLAMAAPVAIDRAVLISPMLGLAARPVGPVLLRLIARRMVAAGKGGDYAWGTGPWQPGEAGEQRQRWLTSDAARYGDERWWVGQYPALALGGVTWGWLDDAFAGIATLNAPGVIEQVAVPMLVLMPDRDALVDCAATRRVARRLQRAELVEYAGAGHELLREADGIRSAALARILAFVDDVPRPLPNVILAPDLSEPT